jgi:macrodomain Ter protein organizer (MatP/YcbG family)
MSTTVRLPPRVEQALASYCVEARKTKSEVIIDLLEQRFAQTVAGKTPYELAVEAGFIGCCEGFNRGPDLKAQVKAAIRAKHKR